MCVLLSKANRTTSRQRKVEAQGLFYCGFCFGVVMGNEI